MRWWYICLFIFSLCFSACHITTFLISIWNNEAPQERLPDVQNPSQSRKFQSAPIWRSQWRRPFIYTKDTFDNPRHTMINPFNPVYEHARSWPSSDTPWTWAANKVLVWPWHQIFTHHYPSPWSIPEQDRHVAPISAKQYMPNQSRLRIRTNQLYPYHLYLSFLPPISPNQRAPFTHISITHSLQAQNHSINPIVLYITSITYIITQKKIIPQQNLLLQLAVRHGRIQLAITYRYCPTSNPTNLSHGHTVEYHGTCHIFTCHLILLIPNTLGKLETHFSSQHQLPSNEFNDLPARKTSKKTLNNPIYIHPSNKSWRVGMHIRSARPLCTDKILIH